MEKHKLVFCGLYDEKNFGDPIIAHCTEWLYSQLLEKEFAVSRLCLDYVEKRNLPIVLRGARKCLRLLGLNWIKYNDKVIKKEYYRYFKKNIKDADLIIVVGGGLIKYTYQYFYAGISGLMDAAEKYGIPVVFNSVGIEGYDASNKKCMLLKSALHRKALRYITTRDDIQTLYNYYFDGKPSIPCLKVADPAVWTSEAYDITRKQSNVIGIGVGRGGLFVDNGKDFSEQQFFSLYIQLIEALSKQGKAIELFTNGMESDNSFASQLQYELCRRNISIKLRIPQTPGEMVKNIASYKCIIAARLHSCIVAYSLNIPAIGFVWNDKLKLWGQNIGAEEFFIEQENLNVDYIIKKIKKLQYYCYSDTKRDIFRNTIKKTIDETIHQYIKPYSIMLTRNRGGNQRLTYGLKALQKQHSSRNHLLMAA